VTASASATVTFVAQPSWTLSKTPNPATYNAAGQVIAYSYLLRNTGNVTINSISISDNKIASVSCPSSSLAAGANMTCTGSYTTTAADLNAGSVNNTATATGTPTSGSLPPATAQATITATVQPAWTLSKTPNPTTYNAAGQAIAYSYVLRNTGNVTINSIAISDNKVSSVSCPSTSLTAGASMSCSGSYAITAADVTTTGSVTNTGRRRAEYLPATELALGHRASHLHVRRLPGSPTAPAPRPPTTGSITISKTALGGNESFNFTSTLGGPGELRRS
jgi:uncharacterized repeat protein (TIGR01451 family)